MSAKLGQMVFNGVLRIKLVELRSATGADGNRRRVRAGWSKIMLMSALLSNGSHATFTQLLKYTLADKDAVALEIPSHKIKNINRDIIQGAALRQTALFETDKDFVPTKLVIECATCGASSAFRPVRITLTPP